ncbi:MAG TPA: response regulator [Candidatus Sulfotelmatobacter sp.]|nr:response regulator [Candidatus Sulfotelmatobacter sp.]
MASEEITGSASGSADPVRPDLVAVVIEDDPQIRRFLRTTLPHHGFRLFEAATADEGLREVERHKPDIMILDLGLPDLDGLAVIQRVREWSEVPILVLSARGQERDKIAALDAGADDYMSKPFGVGELLARMRVVLRRAVRAGQRGQDDGVSFAVGKLQVDLVHRRVTVAGTEIHLTPIEYRLLATLVKYAGKVVTHRQLLTEVWGPACAEEPQYLRVYMVQLRRKLEADPARPQYLLTEQGVGYRLAPE